MAKTINDLLKLSDEIYGVSDNRLYDLSDLFYYHQKWLLRYVDDKKREKMGEAVNNFLVSVAWFFAIENRFHIDLPSALAKRYSWKCPFCLEIPCQCQSPKNRQAKKTGRPASATPKSVCDWQILVDKIYPTGKSEFKNLTILLAQDKFHQAFRHFRHESSRRRLSQIEIASADYFIETLKVSNQLGIDFDKKYTEFFAAGCFVCRKSPCECFYSE